MSTFLSRCITALLCCAIIGAMLSEVEAGGCRPVQQSFAIGGYVQQQAFVPIQTFAPIQQSYSVQTFQAAPVYQQQSFATFAPVYQQRSFNVGYGQQFFNPAFAPGGYGGASFNVGFGFGRQRFFGPRPGRSFRFRGRL